MKEKNNRKERRIAFIGIGTNLGEREKNISYAINNINDMPQSKVLEKSSLYSTQPVNMESDLPFLNMAIKIETELNPAILMESLLVIEKDAGRIRRGRNESRILDLDLLFYDDFMVINEHLTVPHPELHKRRFVLEPMMDIAPDFLHPVLKITINELLKSCPDYHWVVRV